MLAPFVIAIRSNVGGELRSFMVETLLAAAAVAPHLHRPFVLNLDPELRVRTRHGKTTRDDPLYRWGTRFTGGELPVLSGIEVKDFLEQATKPSQLSLTEGRTIILILAEDSPTPPVAAIDETCVLVMHVPGTESFLYRVTHTAQTDSAGAPARVVVVGDASIDHAATFYLQVLQELTVLGIPKEKFSFAGHLSFDSDESVLALSYERTMLEAFPGGVTHGQIKAVVEKLGRMDEARDQMNPSARLAALRLLTSRS